MKLYKIKKSKIDNKGRGLYATKNIKKGTKFIGTRQERLEKSIEKRNEQVQAMKKLAQQQKDDKDTIKRQKDALDNANENALKSKDEIKRLEDEKKKIQDELVLAKKRIEGLQVLEVLVGKQKDERV